MSFDREYYEQKLSEYRTRNTLKTHQRLLVAFSVKEVLTGTDEREIASLLRTEKALDKAESQLRKAEQIARKHNTKKRKERNRKLAIYGVMIEKKLANGSINQKDLEQSLNETITRKSDREFMGLPPLD